MTELILAHSILHLAALILAILQLRMRHIHKTATHYIPTQQNDGMPIGGVGQSEAPPAYSLQQINPADRVAFADSTQSQKDNCYQRPPRDTSKNT